MLERKHPNQYGRRDRVELDGKVDTGGGARMELSKLSDDELGHLERLYERRRRTCLTEEYEVLDGRGPLARRASPEEIQVAFTDWKLVDDLAMDVPEGAPGYARRAEPRFYRLRRE